MDLEFIEATDIADSWFRCIDRIFDVGREYTITRGSYVGQKRLEFDHITVRIKYPAVRPLLPKIPSYMGIPDPASDEYLDEYMPYLMTSVKNLGESYTYGQSLEHQIQEIIEIYNRDGHATNQCCMTVGTPNSIYLEDPECLRCIDTRISDNKLHFVVYFRSNDLWGGYPINMASLQLLKEYIGSMIGVKDGEMIYSSKGLHLYNHVWNIAKQRVGRVE